MQGEGEERFSGEGELTHAERIDIVIYIVRGGIGIGKITQGWLLREGPGAAVSIKHHHV